MKPDDSTLWVSMTEIARLYGKQRMSVYRWCVEGYLIELGYKLKREPKNRWLIGVPPNHPERQRIAAEL